MVTQNAEKIIEKNDTITRPPVVVVLGHVDHGKSSLLEAIREDFRITSREAGGITQHIGAYQVDHEGRKITFIDTPGHEIFSAMRSRGAKVADIAVLVVAADESVKPQTIEAIGQIKKAGIPVVVAINKMDKPGANAQRVRQELSQHGVVVESYGGKVPSVETSATTKQGIKDLLEMILLMAEVEDIRADKNVRGQGVIIESFMDAKRGPTATLLVQAGEVRVGGVIGTRTAAGKVRILEDFQGKDIETASPSMPALVIGFLDAPRVGEQFRVFEDEESLRTHFPEETPKETENVVTLDPAARVVNIIVKADVAGSLEALEEVLRNIPQEGSVLRVMHYGVGEVQESNIKLARSASAHIFSFRTKASAAALDLAEKEGVSIQQFDIIYELIQAVRELLETSAKKEEGRKEVGSLLVLAVFLTDKKRQVVGGKVLEGEVRKGVMVEVMREGEIVGQGEIANVQRDKKNVSLVGKGQECGLAYEGAVSIQRGDRLQFFTG